MSEKRPYYFVTNGQGASDATEIHLFERPCKNDLVLIVGICYRVKEVIIDAINDKVWVAATIHEQGSFYINTQGKIIRK